MMLKIFCVLAVTSFADCQLTIEKASAVIPQVQVNDSSTRLTLKGTIANLFDMMMNGET